MDCGLRGLLLLPVGCELHEKEQGATAVGSLDSINEDIETGTHQEGLGMESH